MVLGWFEALDFAQFLGVLVAANLLMYVGSLGLVAWLQHSLPARRLNAGAAPVSRGDVLLSLAVVAVNVLVGVAGWLPWKRGAITLRDGGAGGALLDLLLLVAYFDLTLYAFHRLLHTEPLFRLAHGRHHAHRDVSGLSLFVMNPVEAAGFGALLIGALVVRDFDVKAVIGFLALNWLFGTVGHSGLRFDSAALRWLAGDSVFHHRHHATGRSNFGFFTPLWDRWLGTAD